MLFIQQVWYKKSENEHRVKVSVDHNFQNTLVKEYKKHRNTFAEKHNAAQMGRMVSKSVIFLFVCPFKEILKH